MRGRGPVFATLRRAGRRRILAARDSKFDSAKQTADKSARLDSPSRRGRPARLTPQDALRQADRRQIRLDSARQKADKARCWILVKSIKYKTEKHFAVEKGYGLGRIYPPFLWRTVKQEKRGISFLRNTTKDKPHEITKNVSNGVNGRMKNSGCSLSLHFLRGETK